MRIDPNAGLTQATTEQAAANANSRPASGASGGQVLGTDQAEFSSDQARVNALSAQVNALPEIRREKVAALHNAVKQGTYRVSPEQTAEAILADLQLGQANAA